MADTFTREQIAEVAAAIERTKQGVPPSPTASHPPDSFNGMVAAAQEERRHLAVEAQQRAAEEREAEEAREAARTQAKAEAEEQLRVQADAELENDPQIRERDEEYRRVDAQYAAQHAALNHKWAPVNERIQLLRRRAAVPPLRGDA